MTGLLPLYQGTDGTSGTTLATRVRMARRKLAVEGSRGESRGDQRVRPNNRFHSSSSQASVSLTAFLDKEQFRMNNSQTLYVPNPRIGTDEEEWKRPREGKASEPVNAAEVPSHEIHAGRRDEKQSGRNSTLAASVRPETARITVDREPVLLSSEEAACAIVQPSIVPTSKMQGTWFREEPW